MTDTDALRTPFAEETGCALLAMLRAAARARLGHDASTALAEIAAHARELRGAAATVGLEPVATAALGIERDALAAGDADAIAVLADTVAALHDGLALSCAAKSCSPRAAPSPSVTGPPAQAPAGAGPTVLLVDDSPVTLRVHADLLRRAGFEVRGARDGADALDMLRAAPVDVIVSDVDMAPMDGLACCAPSATSRPRPSFPSSSSARARPNRSPERAAACTSTPSSPREPPSSSCRARCMPRWPAGTGNPPPACSWPTTPGSCAR